MTRREDLLDLPFDPAKFFEVAKQLGHGRALGLDYVGTIGDEIELALPWREELVGDPAHGFFASGAIVSLIDTSGGAAVWLATGKFQHIATIDLRIDYLRPAPKGETVYARCKCDKLTRQIAFVSGIAHTGNPDHPVAKAAATYILNP